MSTIVHGVIGVAEREGRFLMIQRAQGEEAPGTWCFPGGAVQRGETLPQALRREMLEELAVDVDPIEQVWRWRRDDGELELSWWLVSVTGGTPRPDPAEVQAYRWMTPDEIRSTPEVLPNSVAFLDHYLGREHRRS
jgi:8-oxo-dGTP pyrophosphatase MutT (NUDIX family)